MENGGNENVAAQEQLEFNDDKAWNENDNDNENINNKMLENKYPSKIVEKYFNKGNKSKKAQNSSS